MTKAERPVVGLDLSLTSTGIATPKEVSVIQPKQKGVARLIIIRNTIMDALGLLKNPLVIIEGYSFAQRNSHAHSLGELGGVVRISLAEADIQYVIVAPTQRAKFATGKGNASKSEVVSSISARTGIIWTGKGADDKVDAWVLQEIGLTHLGRSRYNWPQVHLDAMDKIEWPDTK